MVKSWDVTRNTLGRLRTGGGGGGSSLAPRCALTAAAAASCTGTAVNAPIVSVSVEWTGSAPDPM
jgi:hypothetical protein